MNFHLLQGKNLKFCGNLTVVVFVNNSGGVLLLRVSGSARFFSAVQALCKFGNFIEISRNLQTL